MTILCDIMERHGSDKSTCHKYTEIYYEMFKDKQYTDIRLFEMGLGTTDSKYPCYMPYVNAKPGASLYGWREFFKNSQIYGADIDKNTLFSDKNIKTFYCNQKDSISIKNMWDHADLQEPFDIIIDDGLHKANAQYTFLYNSIDKLKIGGYFITEDIKNHTNPSKNEYGKLEELIKVLSRQRSDFEFKFLNLNPEYRPKGDDIRLIVKRLE